MAIAFNLFSSTNALMGKKTFTSVIENVLGHHINNQK
jgi:hypothetical protein